MNTTEAEEMRRALANADDLEVVDAAWRRFDEGELRGLSEDDAFSLQYDATGAARRLLPPESPRIAEVFETRLLPLCLTKVGDSDKVSQLQLLVHTCREFAGEWVNSLTGPKARAQIEAIVAILCTALEREEARSAVLWTVIYVGYRTPELISRLWKLLATSNAADAALLLRTLASLGLTNRDRQKCLSRAFALMQREPTSDLLAVLAALPERHSISALRTAWRNRPPTGRNEAPWDFAHAVAAIARSLPTPRAADDAVAALDEVYRTRRGPFGRGLRLAGNVLPEIDSPGALHLLLRLFADTAADDDYDRWLVMHRLLDYYLPRALGAVDRLRGHIEPVEGMLKKILLRKSDDLGPDRGLTGQSKALAVRTALFLGLPEIEDWLPEFLQVEDSPTRQMEILELFSTLKLKKIPRQIAFWIQKQENLADDPGANREYFVRVAASRLARSAESWEAFSILSRPGLTRKDGVPMASADALVAVALSVGQSPGRRGDVIERLFAAVETPANLAELSCGCRALAAVSRRGWLRTEADRLYRLLEKEPHPQIRPYDQAELVAAVAALKGQVIPSSILERIASWGQEHDDILGERCVQALVELLEVDQHTSWMAPKLGLVQAGDGWDWRADAPTQVSISAPLVVQLFAALPHKYQPAICSVLADDRWFVQYDAVGLLTELFLTGKLTLNEIVKRALVDRARKRQSSRQSDPEVLRRAAMLAPELFAAEPWSEFCRDWLEDSRMSLADAIGEFYPKLRPDPPSETGSEISRLKYRATSHLLALFVDSHFGVRRAAERALGRLAPRTLAQQCLALSRSAEISDRCLAAEALAWLPEAPIFEFTPTPSALKFDQSALWETLESDPSSRVREAARAAADSLRRRRLAEQYVMRIVAQVPSTRSAQLASWRFGNALLQIGDDESLRRLREFLSRSEIPQSYRFWLVRLVKEIDKNWSAQMRRWPQPTATFPGHSEASDAIVWVDEAAVPVKCALWFVPAAGPDDEQRWGGLAVPNNLADGARVAAGLGREVPLNIGSREATKIHIIGTNLGYIEFVGAGKYPSHPPT